MRRLPEHFGTAPGVNLTYLHLNRMIKAPDLSVLFVAEPGHGTPEAVASTWLRAFIPGLTADDPAPIAAGRCS